MFVFEFKVVIRCRPLSSTELTNGNRCVVAIDANNGSVQLTKDGGETRSFTFDAVYDMNSQQAAIYENCGWAIVDSVMEGYNGTMYENKN